MVEYNSSDDNMDGYVGMFGGEKIGDTLKISPKDNTITIKKIRDSRTVAEVIELCQKAIILGGICQKDRLSFTEEFQKFLERNDL